MERAAPLSGEADAKLGINFEIKKRFNKDFETFFFFLNTLNLTDLLTFVRLSVAANRLILQRGRSRLHPMLN